MTGGSPTPGTYSVGASSVNSGNYALKAFCGSGYAIVYKTLSAGQTTLYFRCYVQFYNLPASGSSAVFMFMDTTGFGSDICVGKIANVAGSL